jgi:hypothetical protein
MDLHAREALGASEDSQKAAIQLVIRSQQIPTLDGAAGDLHELTGVNVS